MTASDRLRSAAVLLRERAEAATPGPWHQCERVDIWDDVDEQIGVANVNHLPVAMSGRFWYDVAPGEATAEGDTAFIATMSPTVALAIADWLDWMADRAESGNEHDAMRGLGLTQALATADAILGGAS